MRVVGRGVRPSTSFGKSESDECASVGNGRFGGDGVRIRFFSMVLVAFGFLLWSLEAISADATRRVL